MYETLSRLGRGWKLSVLLLCGTFLAATSAGIVFAEERIAFTSCKPDTQPYCFAPELTDDVAALQAATMPKVATPAWMTAPPPQPRAVTYRVEIRGAITSDIEAFAVFAAETLNDPRGWSRLGVRFERVQTGGDFVLYLSEAARMTEFSATGCDSTYSCNVGNNVIINEDRWKGGTPSWNESGASLDDYRRMVINHETGHWLGHGHRQCRGAGQEAHVMQQQSISLQSCKPNPWPLADEMYSPKLGIRS